MIRPHDASPAAIRQAAPLRRAFTLIELLVVVAIIALLISILLPSLGKAKEFANRVYCAANLRGMAQSLATYATDNNSIFPCVNAPATANTYVNSFAGQTTSGVNSTAADTLMSQMPTLRPGSPIACLWMLVLEPEGGIPPKMLICKSDRSVTSPATRVAANNQLFSNFQDQFDISYSIAYPWAGGGVARAWRYNLDTNTPMMCDMAPLSGDNQKNTLAAKGSAAANSANHEDKGQNVCYGDTHVDWQKDPYCPSNNDNIFTMGPITDQLPITTLGQLPASPSNSDFVMVPVRRTSDGAMGN